MFEQFPMVNLHELNLDWIIQQLIKIEQGAVLSVNGETGDVVLYKDADVRLPDIANSADGTWRFFRYVNGKPVGIKFDENGRAYMVDNFLTETEFYTERNPPDYPVTSVNGQTGEVNLTFPVESVNGQTGAVELYRENGIRFPDVPDTYWNMRREVDHGGTPSIEGVEFSDGSPMKRMSGQNRYNIYDEGNPPPYPVTSVNGQTGAVTIIIPVTSVNGQTGAVTIDPFVSDATSPIMAVYSVPANANKWGLLRQVKEGDTINDVDVGIVFDTTGGNLTGYLRMKNGDTITDLRILTPADIPSDTGVVSVNGMAGAVILRASDIAVSASDARTIETVLNGLEVETNNLNDRVDNAVRNDADVYSSAGTYAVGELVIRSDKLYRCITAITTPEAWNPAHWAETTLEAELTRAVNAVNGNVGIVENGDTASQNINEGQFVIWKGGLYTASSAIASGAALAVGTNLTAVPGGAANALNSNLIGYPDYSNPTDISSYSSSANRYTAPSNGYIFVRSIALNYGRPADGYIGDNNIYSVQADNSQQWQRHCPGLFPIKAGNTFYHITDSEVTPDIVFVPFK